jgi:hypothetical protein
MGNRIKSDQTVVYEFTKEEMEDILLTGLPAKTGEPMPFQPNKISVDFSDPGNGVYQLRLILDEDLPQVLPLRGPAP